MADNLRKTGIDVLGGMSWGTHFCQFYETKKDLLELLVPYFKAGLENNEFCLWIICDPITEKEALEALRQAVAHFDRYLEKQSIEILPCTNWYLKNGRFDASHIGDKWVKKLQNALARGYEGMRVNGNATWLKIDDWDNLMRYENELNDKLRNKPVIALCAYPLSQSGAGALLDVAHTHECVVSKRRGKWEILEEPAIKRINAQLKKKNEELDRRVAERTRELANVIEALKKEIGIRQEAEAQIIREKDLSNVIIDSIPGLVALFDENLRFLRWNKNLETVSGYTPDEMRSLHGIESFYDNEQDKKEASAILDEILEKGFGSAEVSPIMKDGSVITLFFNGRRINYEGKTCLLCIGIDITERKKAEEELRLAYKRLSYHVENTPLAVIESDSNSKITRWSRRAEEIFGWPAPEVMGKSMNDLKMIYEEDRPVVDRLLEDLLQGRADRNMSLSRACTKEGNLIYCEWCNSALRDQQGHVITILALVHDVTKRIKAEEAINQSYRQIRSLTEHLQNVREEERAIIAREIHDELGQQLTVLKMDVAWLNKRLGGADETVRKKFQDLLNILDNTVQSVRRIASELRPGILDDLGLVAAIEWHLNEFEKRSGIKTRFIYPEEEWQLPEKIKTNLYRIFQESLTNVARHSGAGQVKVALVQHNGQLSLTIMDDGRGFDPKKAGEKKTLGLLGMKERTAMIGGTYEIQSQPGKGTVTSVLVPLPQNK
jgi:PAS domain S-box-containing protein